MCVGTEIKFTVSFGDFTQSYFFINFNSRIITNTEKPIFHFSFEILQEHSNSIFKRSFDNVMSLIIIPKCKTFP